ncbi:MAG: hypothetical protein ACRDKT_14145 [Actinomycetota bacterium]
MRRTVIGVVIATLLLAGLVVPAHAGKKAKPRKSELPYSEPAYGTAGVGVCFQGASCAFFGDPLGSEKFVGASIEDDLGYPVFGSVIQDTNEDGNYLAADDLTVNFCGKTSEPVEVEPNKSVSVWVWQGPGAAPACAGAASSGTITAIFSSKP